MDFGEGAFALKILNVRGRTLDYYLAQKYYEYNMA